ncbi:MAG: Ig-like domain-containing protein [Propionibacteriaceae bacterium]|nr:Ig-like domain-containing protein [Propionibacteriaceae bacterium]
MTVQVRTRSVRSGLTASFALIAAFVLMVFTGALNAPWSAADPTSEPTVTPSSELSTTAENCSLSFTAAKPADQTIILSNGADFWQAIFTPTKGDCSWLQVSSFELSLDSPNPAVKISSITERSDGAYVATITSTQAGSFKVNATVQGQPFSSINVLFLASTQDPAESSFSVTPTSAQVDCGGTAPMTATAMVLNTQGMAVPGVPVTFTYSGSSTTRTTNEAGVAKLEWDARLGSSAQQGTFEVSAAMPVDGKATQIGKTTTVTLTASGACSSVSLTATQTVAGAAVPADSKSTYTAEVKLADSANKPITGQASRITFVGSVNGQALANFLSSAVTETSDGVYQATFASNAPLTYQVTAYYGTTPSSPITVTFTTLTPDATRSTLTVTPTSVTMPCDGSTAASVQAVVTLVDAAGTPAAGVTVTLSGTGVATATGPTNSEGKVTFTVPVKGNYPDTTMTINATAQIGGRAVDIKGSPASVSLARAAGCTATPASASAQVSPATQSLGMPVTVTVKMYDADKQLIKDLDPTKLVLTPPSSAVTVGAVKNNGDGSYSATLLSNTVGTYIIDVAYDGTEFTFTTPLTVTYRIGSTLVASPVTQNVGEPIELTLTLINPDTGAPYVGNEITFSTANGHGTFSKTTVTTDAAGKARTTVTSDTAETLTIHATTMTTGGTPGEPASAIAVTFKGSAPVTTPAPVFKVVRTGGATSVLADGKASWTGQVTVTDGDDAPVTSLTAGDFDFTSSAPGITASDVKNSGAGVYTVTFTSTKAGSFTITPSVKGFPAVTGQTITFEAPSTAQVSFDNPLDNDFLGNSTPIISGTSTVTPVVVSEDGTELCTAQELGANGSWACTLTSPLTAGSHTLTATAGVGDNTATATITVHVDTTAPAAPVITSPRAGAILAAPASAVVVSGTAEAGTTVTVTATPSGTRLTRAANTCSDQADSAGAWSCTLAALSAGAHQLSVTATDAAQNTSTVATLALTQEGDATPSPTGGTQPTGSPTGSPSQSPTDPPSPSDTGTPTSSPSDTGTPTSSPSDTGTPTGSPSQSPTISPSPSDTGTPTSSPSSTGTPTQSPTNTPTEGPTGTQSPTGSPTASPTDNPTGSSAPTGSPSSTPSASSSATPSASTSADPSATGNGLGGGNGSGAGKGGSAATGGSANPTPGWSGLIPLALGCALAAAVGARRLRKASN